MKASAIASALFMLGVILGISAYFMDKHASFDDGSFLRVICVSVIATICLLASVAIFAYIGLTVFFPGLPLD